ncbi:MAG: hypothetical protein JRH13_02130 [Deltaproteobacteria bacterium]|nr:hypothetical protein [Deltaproteobacteria bacterium]MBW2015707.1 hypothetical protein [Deltaproteobacteria bacterium]MBW2128143.1 hypothetical protein [Deltaproteobacteria bacterium]MBW2302824.1 hypothetical protein [Deltaproteobacteria bacterium]
MKKILLVMVSLVFFGAGPGICGESFLDVPLVPGGKLIKKTDKRLEMTVPMTHNEVLKFYKDAFKKLKDIKIRDWKDATYIEDDSNLKWHSVTISKEPVDGGTRIVIMKDNWTWIIGTLILRFVGVFVVLLVLFLAMSIAGSIISRSVKKAEAVKKTAA